MQMSARPIGVLDSGVGGLTVASAIKAILPQETIYYIGDTANIPYGEQTTAALQTHVQNIVTYLLAQDCKAIVIACNTATVAAADMVRQYIPSDIPVLNVITPVIDYIAQKYAGKKLGFISTSYTVQSNYYGQCLQAKNQEIHLASLATPLLAPMIEADTYDPAIVEQYLSAPALRDIEGIILGCTHYWFIKEQIKSFYPQPIAVIHGVELLANNLRAVLQERRLLSITSPVADRFMVTRATPSFQKVMRKLFGDSATCQAIDIHEAAARHPNPY